MRVEILEASAPSNMRPPVERGSKVPVQSGTRETPGEHDGPEYFRWEREDTLTLRPGFVPPEELKRHSKPPGLEYEYTIEGGQVVETYVPRPEGQSCGFSRPNANPFEAGPDVTRKMLERHELRLTSEQARDLAQQFAKLTASESFRQRGEQLKDGGADLLPGEFFIQQDGSIVFHPETRPFEIKTMGSGGRKPGTKPRQCIDPKVAPGERVYGVVVTSTDGKDRMFALYPCNNPGGITPEPGVPPTPEGPEARPLSIGSSLGLLALGLGLLGLPLGRNATSARPRSVRATNKTLES